MDRFERDVAPGRVIGSTTSEGVTRRGVDAEGVIEVDHGALRIRPMVEQDWGRSLVTYGPFERRPGLMVAAMVLNGHNTGQAEALPEPMKTRLARWLRGHAEGRRSALGRAAQWLRYRRKSYFLRKLRIWRHMASSRARLFDESLAVGWFSSERPSAPADGGNAFVMHAAPADNGELWTSSGGNLLPVARGIQNVPMCYVSVLRSTGAAYYLASVAGAYGAGTYPTFRPYSIDRAADEPVLYAGVHQAALGQIGFRTDTRVYGVQVEQVEALSRWYGTAHAADRLTSSGPIEGVAAEVGGGWTSAMGGIELSEDGARALGREGVAVLQPVAATGLVHAVVSTPLEGDEAGLAWRYRDASNHYRCTVDHGGMVRVQLILEGVTTELAASRIEEHRPDAAHSLQLTDDGTTLRCAIDGRGAFEKPIDLEHFGDAFGVGVWLSGEGARVRDFEAHPLEVDLSGIVALPAPWQESGDRVVVRDDFDGPAGELAGRTTTEGERTWRRAFGAGRLLVTGQSSVAVDASIERPNPGSTAYLVDWEHPGFVDVSVDVTPPGTGRGEGERGRGGIVLWQDADNFFTISTWLEDYYDGASIAIFAHLDGFEDIYDAVWSMVGSKIRWGAPYRVRVVSDGLHLMVYIDDEPVLYRAVTDFYSDRGPVRINGVGLAVNWEWGNDTGSTFERFEARTREIDA